MASAVIGALRVDLGIDSAAFGDGLKKAQSSIAKFGASVKTGLVAAAAAAGTAVTAMGYAVKNTIDAADDMSKAAQKIGIPIEELSRLKYAADLSGVSFEGLQTSVGRLSRVMAEAGQGNEQAIEAFSRLGISATDSAGALKPASEVLTDLAGKFASMPDGAEKTAAAMELMGRSGANMIPLLNGGAQAMQELMAEADTFGQVFSAEMGASAEVFNDNLSRLQGTFANLAARIATELLPHLRQFTDWLVSNGPAIAEWSGAIVNGLGVVIAEFVRFKQDVTIIITDLQNFAAALTTLAGQIMAFVSGAWAQFVAAWDGMVAKVAEVKAAIVEFAQSIPALFEGLAAQMTEIGAAVIQGLWNGMQSKFSAVTAGVGSFFQGIIDKGRAVMGVQSPSTVMHEVGVNIVEGLGQGMESMQGDIENIAQSIGSTIAGAFKGVIEGSKSVKEALADVLKSLASMLMDKAFNALIGGLFGGGGGGGGIGGFLGSLFGFAQGGSFTVGGTGGMDSQVRALRLTPGEQVSVTKPNQERAGSGPTDVRVWVDENGNWQARVEAISRRTAVPIVQQGIGQYDRQLDRTIGGKVAQAQARQL